MTDQAHATAEQLAAFLGTSAPPNSGRLLLRASSHIDYHTHSAYTVDPDTGLATDDEVAAALADAVCAQIEFWVEVGEASNIDGLASTQQSVGGRSGYRTPPLAPRAHEALANAGLRRPNSGPLVETLP
jgi:hypothetical protein